MSSKEVVPDPAQRVHLSQGTNSGQNAYSDFEEDDDQAAVGSGIVETNENYGDEGYEEVEDEYNDA